MNTNNKLWGAFTALDNYASIYEKYTRNIMEKKGWDLIHYRKDKYYDLLLEKGDKKMKIEVKSCNKTFYTPNIFIECQSHGNDSFYRVTEAEYIFYYMPSLGKIWVFKTDDLKDAIERYHPKNNIIGEWSYRYGGDKQKSYGHLWKREAMIEAMGDKMIVLNDNNIKKMVNIGASKKLI